MDLPAKKGRAAIRGRGAAENPPNRFERIEYVPEEEEGEEGLPGPATECFRDTSRKILSYNQSPDVGFEVSVNPYRGCEHGCVYCYARPFHEYLGFSAGLDFETKILVKPEAPELLRRELLSPNWRPQPIALSGVTDPYQPLERGFKITRRCLQVLTEFRNPVVVVTKNHLVTRDIDLLAELARWKAAVVNLSITTLDRRLQHLMEPRASTPKRRLGAIRDLVRARIPVRVLVAPVIPGLTDHEIPSIIKAAAQAGAGRASYILLRLPHGVKGLVENWLERHYPGRKSRVLSRLRETRGGKLLYDSRFHVRMRGEGVLAAQIEALFEAACRKSGMKRSGCSLSTAAFGRPHPSGQLGLFGESLKKMTR
ncbi:MAG: PA0069 family radical SAM protein [Acidobacteriota bacterium]